MNKKQSQKDNSTVICNETFSAELKTKPLNPKSTENRNESNVIKDGEEK